MAWEEKTCGTAANDSSLGGVAFSDVTWAQGAEDGNYAATASLTVGQFSQLLKATNFGFQIPSGATIVAIEVTAGVSNGTIA
jgi:hypothetical protein